MTTLAASVQRAHLATTATVVLLVVADPLRGLRGGSRGGQEWSTWVRGQQRLDRVMSRVAPVLFVATGTTALAAAGVAGLQHRPARAACRLVTAGAVGAAVAVTLRVNEPVNDQLRSWSPEDPPVADWRTVRARWERGHRVRRGLLAMAAGAAAVGALVPG